MSLRVSSSQANPAAVMSEDASVDTGVECGDELRTYARVALRGDRGKIESSARAIASSLGPLALAHAAGVVAFFDAINRVADATGVVLDDDVEVPAGVDLRPIEARRATVVD